MAKKPPERPQSANLPNLPYLHPISKQISENEQIKGNIVPMVWFQNIRRESGLSDTIAPIILADIYWWYTPYVKRSNDPSIDDVNATKKMDWGTLERKPSYYAEKMGITKRQAKAAMDNLVRLELIFREPVPSAKFNGKGKTLTGLVFVWPNVKKILEISNIKNKLTDPLRIYVPPPYRYSYPT